MVSCPYVLEGRNKLLEAFLYYIRLQKYVNFDLQDTEIQCSALLGSIENTSFDHIPPDQWAKVINCVSKYECIL